MNCVEGGDASVLEKACYEPLTEEKRSFLNEWLNDWRSALGGTAGVVERMRSENPKHILREWMLVEAYDAAGASLLEAAAAGDDVYAFLCTHNAASCEKALSKADALHLERGDDRLKFAQILGLCDGLTRSLAAAGCRAHKLVLFGATRDLAPWIGRRLAENADALGAPAAEAPALWRELARRVVG